MSNIRTLALVFSLAPAAGHAASACDALPAQPGPGQVATLVACVHDAHARERKQIPAFVATWQGMGENPSQSLTPTPPFERYPVVLELGVDVGRVTTLHATSALPGGFAFRNLFVQAPDGSVVDYDLARGFRTEASAMPPTVLRLDPLRLAEQLAAAKVAWVSTDAAGVVTLEATRENGTKFEVGIAPSTAQIVRYRQALPAGFQGAGTFNVQLVYGEGAPRHLPVSLDVSLVSEKLAPMHNVLERTSFERVAPKTVQGHGAAGFPVEQRAWRPARTVEKLSDHAYLLRNLTETTGQWSYNVVAVKGDEGWWVLEAPVSDEVTTWIAQELGKRAPSLPIAGVVQSHHHHDHLSGISPYLVRGAVISTPAVATLLKERFDYTNTQAVAEGATRDLGDRLRVFALDADPHAGAMLVSYLPQEQTLFQADLVNLREYPDNAASTHFRAWVRDSGLRVRRIAGVHGDVLQGEELAAWLAQ